MASLTQWTWVWASSGSDGQGGLACCSPQGRKESDMTERLNWTERINHQIRKCHGGDKKKDKISLGTKVTMNQFSRHPKSGKMVLDSWRNLHQQRKGDCNKKQMLVVQLCPTLCGPMDCSLTVDCPWSSPGKSAEVDSHSLLQGIFLTQGWNLGLQPCRQDLKNRPCHYCKLI